jgi:hypothetical protein
MPRKPLKMILRFLGAVVFSGVVLLGALFLTGWKIPFNIPFIGLLLMCSFGILGGLFAAFAPTPLPERYRSRAAQFAECDPEQALADYAHALELGKARNLHVFCQSVLYERAQFHKRLGRRIDAVSDLEAYLASLRTTGGAEAAARIDLVEVEIKRLRQVIEASSSRKGA